MCTIRDVGGTTIAQKPSTASEPSMPESAMASGCIDFVLSPEAIAQQIISIASAENRPHPPLPGEPA
jgi:chemotaxis response regulator CheB